MRVLVCIIREIPRTLLSATGSLIAGGFLHWYFFGPVPHPEFHEEVTDSQFVKFTDEIIRLEGGFVLSDGGATYAGINRAAHPDSPLWKMHLSTPPSEQVKAQVYREYMMGYYKRLRIADLPEQIGFLVYDFGVNAGNVTSAKTVQGVVFSDPRQVDGHIGPFSINAINGADDNLPHRFSFKRMSYYTHLVLRDPEKHGNDLEAWESRVDKALQFSQSLE